MTIDANSVPPVDGAALADKIEEFVRRYVVFPHEHAYAATTLWILHTWAIEEFEVSPRLAFISVERGSGKTRALEILSHLTREAAIFSSMSPSFLFRRIAQEPVPTVMFDEADNYFSGRLSESAMEILAVMNSGYKRGGNVGRAVVGNGRGEVSAVTFPSFAPLALGSILNLPDTLQSRSIVVLMKRRRKQDTLVPYRERYIRGEALGLREECASWAEQSSDAIKGIGFPSLPAGIEDRAAELWETPVAIADVLGGAWPVRARAAAVAFVDEADQRPLSKGERLLVDVHTVFGERDGMASTELLRGLHELETGTWSEYGRSRMPLDGKALARMLSAFDILTGQTIRINGGEPVKGYRRTYFLDAWERYTPHLLTTPGAEIEAL
jgi:hypothetical protein